MLGQVLLSTINLAYYQALMAGMREAIEAGRFARLPRRDPGAMGERADIAGGLMNVLRNPIPRPSPQAALQSAAGRDRRALPRVRTGGEISLRAGPALHAGRCAERNAGGAARASGRRARGDRAGELPRHRQCRDARRHRVQPQALSAASPLSTTASPTPISTSCTPAACAACASISSSISAARPTWRCFDRVIDRIKDRGWHVVLHLDAPDIVPLSDMIRKLPLPFVIDHMGRVPAAAGVDQPPLARADRAFTAGKLLDQSQRRRAHFHAAL